MGLQAVDLVAIGIVAVPLLVGNRWVRPLAVKALRPAGVRLLAALNPPPEVDEAAEELSRVLRRERLHADLARLERILATDMSMSATRQIGNRLAHAWLVRELDASTSDLPPWIQDPGMTLDALGPSLISFGAQERRYAPKVETLIVSWRH